MDRLTAFVAIAHLRLRLDYVARHPELLENTSMATPILQGLGQMLAKLEHNLEAAATPLAQKIASVESGGLDAIKRAHVKVDGIKSRVKEIEGYVAAIISNGGDDPLDGSSDSSGKPEGSAAGTGVMPTAEKSAPEVAQIEGEPEHLTVNGVQAQPRCPT